MIRFSSTQVFCALLASSALASPAFAQVDSDFIPPVRQAVDQNGVDLATGELSLSAPVISIGSGAAGLSYARNLQFTAGSAIWDHPFQYAAYGLAGSSVQVVAGNRTVDFSFDSPSGKYVNQQGSGETLTVSGSTWTFTLRDGTVIELDDSDYGPNVNDFRFYGSNVLGVAHTIIFPNKQKLTLTYKEVEVNGLTVIGRLRVQSVQSSSGFMAKLEYLGNGAWGDGGWWGLKKVTLLNNASDYCNPAADTCTFSQSWPSLSFSGVINGDNTQTLTVSDVLNRSTVYTIGYADASNGKIKSIQRPSSSTANTIITYDATHGRVASITADGRTWTYSWSLAAPLMTATVTNPDGTHKTIVTDTTLGVIKSDTDELNRQTSYSYDTKGRLTDVIYPEGNKANYTYDDRGNVTEKRLISKTPGTPADIVTSASYPATCTNAVTCNEPTRTTDARGNTTDFTYDSTHGGVLTATRPAPTTGAVRPQTRYGYTALQGYFKNSAGSIVASGQSTYLLTSISECQTNSSCAGTADEVKATIGYGPQTAGTANNLLPVSASKGSGDGALTATNALTYDSVGNVTYVDGPLSGTSDRTRILYDAARQTIGQISPDPDSGGALPNRALRKTYNLDGQLTKQEIGTTAGQTDTNWNAFSSAQSVDVAYDSSGREVSRKLSAGGTTYAVTQASYDANGRPQCSAIRMNPATFASLPSDACTIGGSGLYGPDRIQKISYDAAGEPIKSEEGIGTSAARAERTLTYSDNGKVKTLKDGGDNLTTYTYDGFDRLIKTQFPNTSQGSGTSSTTDYEQLTYDANGNVTSRRLRDGNSLSYSYDKLDRMTHKGGPIADKDYSYDNLGRMLTAKFSTGGLGITNDFDALDRLTSSSSDVDGTARTVSYQYDLAGRRTRLTWPDGFYVDYDYLTTGEMTKVRENGASSGIGVLATYGYDSLGRRTSRTLGNGTEQNYGYDAVSRLTSLAADFAGTTNDLTIGTITYNPANEINSAPRSNTAFSFNGLVGVNRPYVSNGLNQYTSVASNIYTYDARGNLTSDGTNSFTYSPENLLTSGPNSTSLSYDPLLRLTQVSSPSETLRFVYDGDHMIAHYNGSGALQYRYVFGPDADEPLLQYNPSGVRTWYSADERGSIVADSSDSGALVGTLSYDEYGIPGTGNSGRFQYTGQMWIAELGMYYYKARFYSPTLGRFMQTDPIGYGDGPNWYAYVHNDPVNFADPMGLCGGPSTSGPNGEIIITGCLPVNAPVELHLLQGLGNLEQGGDPFKDRNPVNRPQKTRTQCALQALGKNWKGLGLDALGWAANLALPEGSAGVAIAGSAIGVAGLGVAIADNKGPADAAVAGSLALTGKYAAGAEGLLRGAGSAIGHRVGFVALSASTAYDAAKTAVDFKECMSGK